VMGGDVESILSCDWHPISTAINPIWLSTTTNHKNSCAETMVMTTQDTNTTPFIYSNSSNSSWMAGLPLPRTGKRGVPQQFPRRLYEMLDGETALLLAETAVVRHQRQQQQQPPHVKLIEWSASGKAFRIHNVEAFAKTVLPKYFRTNKFSSFQRNLNLVRVVRVCVCATLHSLLLLLAEKWACYHTTHFWQHHGWCNAESSHETDVDDWLQSCTV
jgi:HSF-type DNA-binding